DEVASHAFLPSRGLADHAGQPVRPGGRREAVGPELGVAVCVPIEGWRLEPVTLKGPHAEFDLRMVAGREGPRVAADGDHQLPWYGRGLPRARVGPNRTVPTLTLPRKGGRGVSGGLARGP